jgi:7-cyano-7-deazaguanine synthase
MSHKRAIVLLSGGLDSATTLAMAVSQGFECHALSIRYGQKHASELAAAERVARSLAAASHAIVELPGELFAGSALTDADIRVPEHGGDGIPATYVPARNTVFLSIALGRAELLGADAIFIGVNALDYSGYPDCRPEFIAAFQAVANCATRQAIEGHPIQIEAPLVHLTKAQIIRTGTALGVDYSLTVSCYNADSAGRACGRCDSCRLRTEGFAAAGSADPTSYFVASNGCDER